jgi:hypothetical protein
VNNGEPREEWHEVEMVFVVRPPPILCPHCGASRRFILKSLRGGDGSVSRRCLCRSCLRRYIVVVELSPTTGGCEHDDR